LISKIWWNIKKISQIYSKKSKKIPQKFPIFLLKKGEISPQKNTVPYVFISISFTCLKCYVFMFPILIAQLIVSSLAKVLSLYTFYAYFNTLPIALHLLGFIYRVSVTQNMNLTKDFIGCSLIVNGENGGHGDYYQN
jgi:hypothetical protein